MIHALYLVLLFASVYSLSGYSCKVYQDGPRTVYQSFPPEDLGKDCLIWYEAQNGTQRIVIAITNQDGNAAEVISANNSFLTTSRCFPFIFISSDCISQNSFPYKVTCNIGCPEPTPSTLHPRTEPTSSENSVTRWIHFFLSIAVLVPIFLCLLAKHLLCRCPLYTPLKTTSNNLQNIKLEEV